MPQMLYECNQNAPGMAAEYGSNVQEFKQNDVGILRIYFECNTNVPGVSRILPDRVENAAEFSIFIR